MSRLGGGREKNGVRGHCLVIQLIKLVGFWVSRIDEYAAHVSRIAHDRVFLAFGLLRT